MANGNATYHSWLDVDLFCVAQSIFELNTKVAFGSLPQARPGSSRCRQGGSGWRASMLCAAGMFGYRRRPSRKPEKVCAHFRFLYSLRPYPFRPRLPLLVENKLRHWVGLIET
ncbi:hypothetical protein MUY21_09880 [Aliiroseovarius sp. S2029]|nr:hypothetical protein [Aliiroseovarius sp. S2029]